MTTQKYIPIWKKYRPAILKLMVDSANGPQEYAFSDHEFKDINPKQKGGYSFVMKLHKSRAISDIKESAIANDLLTILQQSEKASELSGEAIYELALDKGLVLHVTREELPEAEKPAEELQEEEQAAVEPEDVAQPEEALPEEEKPVGALEEAGQSEEASPEEEKSVGALTEVDQPGEESVKEAPVKKEKSVKKVGK